MAITLTLALALLAARTPAETRSEDVVQDLREPRVLGTPIQVANLISYKLCPGQGREGHDLFCFTSTAESGAHFVALDLVDGRLDVRPVNHLEGYPIVPASDRNVYMGSSSGEIMQYRPTDGGWRALARVWEPTQGLHHVRAMGEGPDGWLYCGSCYGERARVSMSSGKVEPLLAIPGAGGWYVSSVAGLPDGRIAFGLGHVARVFVYDPAKGQDVGQWAPPEWQKDGFALNLLMGQRVLFATHFPSGRRGAYEAATGRFLGEAPWPPMQVYPKWSVWWHSSGYGSGIDCYVIPGTDTLIACDGKRVYEWDPLAGRSRDLPVARFEPPAALAADMRYAVSADLHVLEYDARRLKVLRDFAPELPPTKRGLFALGVGSDGCVYGGAYQCMHLFRYDPRKDELVDLGNHNPSWSGETYSFCLRGRELVCASYINGVVVLYDPVRPWACDSRRQRNPRFVGCLGQFTYRPLACVAARDGRIWGVGAAGWGTTGGGVSWIDPATGKTGTTQLPEAPWMVGELPDGDLLIGSASCLRWWDPTANREEARFPWPARAAGDVVIIEEGPPTRIAFADQAGVHFGHVVEPGKVEVDWTFASPVACAKLLWADGRLIAGGGNGIAELDPHTDRWVVFCAAGPVSRFAFVATAKSVYFTRDAELLRVDRPGG